MYAQGPARPIHNTQAAPVLPEGKRAPTSMRLWIKNFAGSEHNAKSSMNVQYLIVMFIIPAPGCLSRNFIVYSCLSLTLGLEWFYAKF